MQIKSMRHIAMAFGMAFGSLLLTACGASGPAFKKMDPPGEGKGIVYIYRSPAGFGQAVHGTIRADGKKVTDVKNGGYFPYVGPVGSTKFEIKTEASNDATVKVESSIDKYLKVTVGMGFFVGHLHLTEVSPDIGQKEVAECKLLDPEAP